MKNLLYFKIFICFLFFINQLYASKKIVVLVSPPRSLSTAFLRMMEARGDFEVILEPSLIIGKNMEKKELTDFILEKAEQTNLFIKELSLSNSFLYNNADFIKKNNVHFIFLMRNPHHQIISIYKKIADSKEKEGKDPVGKHSYTCFYNLFNYVQKNATNNPCIVLAEDLYLKTEDTYNLLCNFLKIPYKKEALFWNSLGAEFNGNTWNNNLPIGSGVHFWQEDAINSTGFHLPTQYKLDAMGNPSFQEVKEKHKKICLEAYTECLVLYNKIWTNQDYFLRNLTHKNGI